VLLSDHLSPPPKACYSDSLGSVPSRSCIDSIPGLAPKSLAGAGGGHREAAAGQGGGSQTSRGVDRGRARR
jgi:hypothetical protein